MKPKFYDQFDDLAYAIRRGRVKFVQEEITMDQTFKGDHIFRENGETMLHVCAEYD